jgi:hypothetical protein
MLDYYRAHEQRENVSSLRAKLKAYVQWFNNGLAEDNLYR